MASKFDFKHFTFPYTEPVGGIPTCVLKGEDDENEDDFGGGIVNGGDGRCGIPCSGNQIRPKGRACRTYPTSQGH